MDLSFRNEDQRKDRLWLAWNEQLDSNQKNFGETSDFEFESIYEGVIQINKITSHQLVVSLETKEEISNLVMSAQVKKDIKMEDNFYVVMGLHNGKWWPLNVFSIGSIISVAQGKMHFSVNPRMMKTLEQRGIH